MPAADGDQTDPARMPARPSGRTSAPEPARLSPATDDAPEERLDMPLPRSARSVFQGGLFLLAVLAALFVARDIMLPVVIAIVLKLLLQPLVRLLERGRIPKAIGALIAILILVLVFAALGGLVGDRAVGYIQQLPQAWPKILQRFEIVRRLATDLQATLDNLGIAIDLAGGKGFDPTAMLTGVFASTGNIATSALETLLILFYLLVFGETFLRRLVEILPRFADKRDAVNISQQIERDLSAYLLTITVINAIVGIANALVMWLCGVPGAVMWGVLAFAFNYVPILGPFIGVVVYLAVGVLVKGVTWFSLIPAVAYLAIHVLEGETITPMLLAHRFTINPVAVILGLIFWHWMWGVPGAVLAVPLLAVIKIVCDRIRPFRAFGHMLEG